MIRAWVIAFSLLPPDRPLLALLIGLAQDVAILAPVGAVALLLARTRLAGAARLTLATVILLLIVAQVAWAEALLYFGHPPRREDIALAVGTSFLHDSLDAPSLARLGILLLGAGSLLVASAFAAARAQAAWSSARRWTVAGASALAIAAAAWRVHASQTVSNHAFAAARLLSERRPVAADGTAEVPTPRLPASALHALAPRIPESSYVDPEFPLAHRPVPRDPRAPHAPAGLKPNVILLVMEGVRARSMEAYGATVKGITPNLDRLAAQGVLVEAAYSPGTHTPEGELGLWYGLQPLPHEFAMTTRPTIRVNGLPDILGSWGWNDVLWIHGGDQTFYERGRFYTPRDIQVIDGRDFPPSAVHTNWGYSDRELARETVRALDHLEEPFAAMSLTVTNHHPFQVPSDSADPFTIDHEEERGFVRVPGVRELVGRHTVPMLKTVHYTDEAIGLFFAMARRRPWYARTLFVVTSDHGLPVMPLRGPMTPHRLARLRHRVPLLFVSDLLPEHGVRVPGAASQIDVLPTVLGFVGNPEVVPGLGRDLLDPGSTDPDRPVVCWDTEGRMVSVFTARFSYHGTLPDDVQWNPTSFEREILVDETSDPDGLENVAAAHAGVVARLRAAAIAYLDVYPSLLVQGRTGLPEKNRSIASR
ncbi:MAG TPA: LTA synthase family protein [Thermoanaerobaculia bacterium]|nr:LTA synthase family protein [Thermoanaerobaculia bacterium]